MPENDQPEVVENGVLLETGSIDTTAFILPATTEQISILLPQAEEELVDDDVIGGEVRYELDASGAVLEIIP